MARRLLLMEEVFPHCKDSYEMEKFADDNFYFLKNGRKFSRGKKTLRKKEKLLVTSNFSFSHSVFKELVLQTFNKQMALFDILHDYL